MHVSNCTIYDCSDGCIDVTVESDFVTIAHCRFYYQEVTFHKFVNLIGASDDNITDRGKLHVTFHHNWWDTGCSSRMPRVRFGYVHIYNNYFSCVENNYCSRAGLEAHLFSEYNYFDGVRSPLTAEDEGVVKSIGNEYVNCTGTIHPGTDESFTPSYPYASTTPQEAKELSKTNAGNTNENPITEALKMETIINWTDQEAIIFGTPLSDKQLNAVAIGNTNSPIYSHPAETLLPEGYQTLTVTFPEDENYKAASKTVNIRVNYDYYTLSVHAENATSTDLIHINPDGQIIDGELSYPLDSVVTLTATNNILSTFERWHDNSTKPILSVIMSENKEVTAYYTPLSYIAAWDFYTDGNKDRKADFYSSDVNQDATLLVRDEDGSSISWIDYSGANLLEEKNAAMIRRSPSSADKYYFQIQFDASQYENIKVDAKMLGINTYYQIQNVEYSVDAISFTKLGEVNLAEESTWISTTQQLPNNTNGAPLITVRFKPDTNSQLISDGVTGTSISEVRVLADYTDPTPVQEVINTDLQVINRQYFTLDGKPVKQAVKGINIIIVTFEDGSRTVKKVLVPVTSSRLYN